MDTLRVGQYLHYLVTDERGNQWPHDARITAIDADKIEALVQVAGRATEKMYFDASTHKEINNKGKLEAITIGKYLKLQRRINSRG